MGRSSSPELGDPKFLQQYNRKTGRPIRRSAGRVVARMDGYVDSTLIEDEDEDEEPIEVLTEDEDDYKAKGARARKRKRTPSPTPPPLETLIYEDEDTDADGLSDEDAVDMIHQNPSETAPITLQFNIPLGFQGPLVVKLDRDFLEAANGKDHAVVSRYASNLQTAGAPKQVDTGTALGKPDENRPGFLDLPPELRNKVYRSLFVSDGEFDFASPTDFSVSAQVLRCCKTVYREGCSILYGENKFTFDRNRHTRAKFWQAVPKEIGYQDVRQFLNMIGPQNLLYLREIKLVLEDAIPSTTPYLGSVEERRYVNDGHLIDCLRTLRRTKLRKLTMVFFGRRSLSKSDVKFVRYLEQLKADTVDAPPANRGMVHHGSWIHHRIFSGFLIHLKDTMTRKTKLYAEM